MPSINVTNLIRILGPHGFTIYTAAKHYLFNVNKDILAERVPMTKVQFQQGWARIEALRILEEDAETWINAQQLILAIATGFESGAWIKEEVAACDWKQLFAETWQGEEVNLGKIQVESVSIGTMGGRPVVIVNENMQVVPSRRSCKKVSGVKPLTTFFFGERRKTKVKNQPAADPYATTRKKAQLDKPVEEWKLDEFVEYVYNLLDERGQTQTIGKTALRKISLVRNGIDALGHQMKEKATAKKRVNYKKFVDWLVKQSPYKDSLSPGNFVSKATMVAWKCQGGDAGTVSGGRTSKDYGEGTKVNF